MNGLEKSILLDFNGKKHNIQLELDNKSESYLSECLNALNKDELFNYLYNYHLDLFNEINQDSYYEGKTIKSGIDLKNSIDYIKKIACKDEVIYVCGEYWCDPEHGFSITFPKGKFVKSMYNKFEYNRDIGKEVGYIPVCTVLGQYSDYL